MQNNKLLRWVVGGISICWIIYMWVEKDIASVYAGMPAEQMLPLVLTTVAVTLAKVALLAGGVLLVKWIIGKFKNR